MGDDAHAYFRVLLSQKESYWFRIARSILGLSKRYGNESVNLTLKRALYYTVTDVLTIKNILEKKLYLLPEEPKLLGRTVPEEPIQTEQTGLFRDLTYYTITERSSQ